MTSMASCHIQRTVARVDNTYPPSRNPRINTRQPLPIRQQRLVHVRRDIPRRDGIHGDAPRGPLVGERLGQLAHGALGGGVGRDGQAALEGEEGGEVDDGAASTGEGGNGEGEDVGGEGAGEGEGGVEVYLEDLWRG